MVFPHPKSRKDKYRNGDKPNHGGVVWKFFKRTINITGYRNAKDEVNQARNPTFGGITDHLLILLCMKYSIQAPAGSFWRIPRPRFLFVCLEHSGDSVHRICTPLPWSQEDGLSWS